MNNTSGKFVSVYRAITGSPSLVKRQFSGVGDRQLRKYGVFTENRSLVQTKENFFLEGGLHRGEHVIGLPVFLTRGQAQDWLEDYGYKEPPALIQVDVPIGWLTGELPRLAIVNNNVVNPDLDRLLSQDELQKLSSGEGLRAVREYVLRGVYGNEFNIQNTGYVPEDLMRELRRFEKIFRPHELVDGELLKGAPYDEINLPEEPIESVSQLPRN